MRCPRCNAENAPAAKFCGECGAPFDSSIGTPVSATGSVHRANLSGERRHLTVLFCDLVGSTAIAARLDPEQWRETMAGYHRVAAEAITRFDGHVAKYLGDGVMAYFGWPVAHDNDAERAARAGLAILDAIAKLNEQPGHANLSARVGIDSGLVVIAKGAGHEAEVFGDTPNIAARVQATAEPGTVGITDATHRLVSGLFVVEDRGAHELKGIERPLQLYGVVRPSGMRGRFPAIAAMRGMTPFVGREDELRSLLHRWERVCDGEGQVVTIIGEGGIGKSRLLQRFREELAATPFTWLECATAPFFQNTPFYAVTDMLQQSFHWEPSHTNEQRLAALEASLGLAGLDPDEAVPLIAPLLELPVGTKYPPLSMAPDQQRKRLLATLVGWTFGTAKAQPLVIATEDLHWADPSTLELIQLLVEQGAPARLLLLYTARPEFRAPWPMRAHHTQINLNRLTAGNVRTMVAQVAAKIALSDETVAAVVERTGGVPLFVEELTRAVLESCDAKPMGREIPATLHDSLMARLDRLGPAKEVIQVGAVIGSEFSYELLRAVHPIGEADLQAALRSLADAELLYVRGIAPDATYQFKHALIRDAAYEALLKSRRKDLHLMVARTIEEKFPALKEAHPEVLARHWAEAGEAERSIAEWSKAGKAAYARNAFMEALESYKQAVSLVGLLPKSPERDLRELELSDLVVVMLYVTKGYAAPETVDAIARFAALAEKSGNLPQLVRSVFRRGFTAFVLGDLAAAGTLADEALALAQREGNSHDLAAGHGLQIWVRYWRGDLLGVEEHFANGLKFFDDPAYRRARGGGAIPGNGPLIAWMYPVFAYASWSAWTLGQTEIAHKREAQMMAVVTANDPYDVAYSKALAARLRGYMREYKQAEALATDALELSERHHLPYPTALSRCVLGQARAQLGNAAEGIDLIRKGIAGLLEIGSRFGISNYIAYLAEAQKCEGSITDALETVERALQANPDELLYRPETLRIRGELRLKQGNTGLAKDDFREAIALAQSMSAKSWELRATMSLARLLDDQGRRGEARTMLADIHGWFTEGFDTADLKDAKALLEELNA
jgi:class 3 adenylate cyclase/tetratricopeptide (TPR) repeat protein